MLPRMALSAAQVRGCTVIPMPPLMTLPSALRRIAKRWTSAADKKRQPGDEEPSPRRIPPPLQPQLHRDAQQRALRPADGGYQGHCLLRLGRGDAGVCGRKRSPARGSLSPGPPAPRRPHRRGGEGGDPRDGNSAHDHASKFDCSDPTPLCSNTDFSLGGPAGIGGACAPASPMEREQRRGGDLCHGDASVAALVSADASSREVAASAAAAGPAAAHRPGANASAANATWGPAPTLAAQPRRACPAAMLPPVEAEPSTRAELLTRLRGIKRAPENGAPGAVAIAREGDCPARPRAACMSGDSIGSRTIRGRRGEYSAAPAPASSNKHSRVASSLAAATVRAAGDAAVTGDVADAVSARIHPVPIVVSAGVEAATGVPPMADAVSAPARRRIVGKQRIPESGQLRPSRAAASTTRSHRDEVLHLGRARAERPPD